MDMAISLHILAQLEEAEQDFEDRQARVARNGFSDPFEVLSETMFVREYRLTKALCQNLIDRLTPFLRAPVTSNGLTIPRKVLTALRFFGSGSYQLNVGTNFHSGVSQSSVSRCVEEVSAAMNRMEIFGEFVKFPKNMEELRRVRNEFFEKYGFPGVIGAIDCTHVAVISPGAKEPYPEKLYVNQKGYHSINTQLVCDSNLRIIHVCARFPGSTTDSSVLEHSNLSQMLQRLHANGPKSFHLLGDSDYPLKTWLMTPLNNSEPGTPEDSYNQRLMSTRSVIERCNRLLKLRFRCLLKQRVLYYHPEKASRIINVCVMLHNMCIMHNVEEPPADEQMDFDFGIYEAAGVDADDNGAASRANPELLAARRLREQLILEHFL